MFERYTESARQVLFFARYEASKTGATSIDSEHLLLGLTREARGLIARVLAKSSVLPEDLRGEVTQRVVARDRVPLSRELPFSLETRRVLNFAAEEADHLKHTHIGTGHLLLGLLREEGCVASTILTTHGVRLDGVRGEIANVRDEAVIRSANPLAAILDEVLRLVEQLGHASADTPEARELVERIRRELNGLKMLISG